MDRKIWLHIDCKELNKVTIKNNDHFLELMSYLINFKVHQCFQNWLETKVSSTKSQGILKTDIRARYMHFEFLMMSFSLTNVPATFMDLINRVFKKYICYNFY